MTNYPRSVRATEQVLDEGRVFAERGEVGAVVDAEAYEDGTRALTVIFANAPCATTCFLGENCEEAPTLLA